MRRDGAPGGGGSHALLVVVVVVVVAVVVAATLPVEVLVARMASRAIARERLARG